MPEPKRPLELFTRTPEELIPKDEWQNLLLTSFCPYIDRKCDKTRKSQPDVSIGTCTVGYMDMPVIICPHRFLQRRQIFIDALHLLEHHQPGHQLHVIPEISLPGGSIDYFVASVYRGEIRDYVALELQTMDTTGSVWYSRQRLINDQLGISTLEAAEEKSYGINWKMTAKTILMQMHLKAETLELLGKKLVLVVQDVFYNYIESAFQTSSLRNPDERNSVHFHVYALNREAAGTLSLELKFRPSTTAPGIEQILGLRESKFIPEETLLARLHAKISERTLLTI